MSPYLPFIGTLILAVIFIYSAWIYFERNAYRDALHSVIRGIEATEPRISRAVKAKICFQATQEETERFLNFVVKTVTERPQKK
jgi:hypothetical protein